MKAAFGNQQSVAWFGQITDLLSSFCVRYQSARRYWHNAIGSRLAGAVAAAAIVAMLRSVHGMKAKIG